jgi:hypothetical protein
MSTAGAARMLAPANPKRVHMRKKVLVPTTLLALAAACGDSTMTSPTATTTIGPEMAGPSLDLISAKDGSLDAVSKIMPLNVGGGSKTTTLYVTPTGGDGKPGCNLTGSTTLVIATASSNTAVATVSPSSVTFEACSDVKTLTITPVAQGTATISVSQTSNSTGGTFNLGAATFTVNVAPPANTAPSIAVALVDEGASYNKGSVPTATCQVTDAEDGNSSFAATLTAVTGTYASDGIGSQTASCYYKDTGGLEVSASETYSIIDPSAPVIGFTLNPATADGSNGWHKSSVALDWTVTEGESPNSLQLTNCADQTIATDGEHAIKCSATSAGGAADNTATFKRDATAPVISGANINSTTWRNTDLSASFTASDATSGLANAADASFTLATSGESTNATTPLTDSKTVTDNAGNSSTRTISAFVDKTKPVVNLVGGPVAGSSFFFGETPAAPTCSASDALSGLAGSCSITGYSAAVGTQTVTATATDIAGNTQTATATYTVKAWTINGFYQPVDMNGIVNTVKAGSTVPLKFEVFAGAELVDVATIGVVFTAKATSCLATASVDEIEVLSTGGTSLRYDATAGQFIQNWQTPKQIGGCYTATVKTADGTSISAIFKLR